MQQFTRRLLVGYVRLVAGTTRWHVEGREHLEAALEEDGSAVVCFWHGRLMLFPVDWPWPERTHVLISAHRDGQLGGSIAEGFGLHTVSGSTERGGALALRRLVRLVRAGDIVAITPDGPRGPRGVPHAGATAARAAHAVCASCRCPGLSAGASSSEAGTACCCRFPSIAASICSAKRCRSRTTTPCRASREALDGLTDRADRLCGHDPLPSTAAS